ncbi:MAG: hypothetical protein JWM23_1351 [Microbacteriaceae bacterium]|jgi:hypothetical protein|nr:hypothetical protein [Microbacteriaceae bacterium]
MVLFDNTQGGPAGPANRHLPHLLRTLIGMLSSTSTSIRSSTQQLVSEVVLLLQAISAEVVRAPTTSAIVTARVCRLIKSSRAARYSQHEGDNVPKR